MFGVKIFLGYLVIFGPPSLKCGQGWFACATQVCKRPIVSVLGTVTVLGTHRSAAATHPHRYNTQHTHQHHRITLTTIHIQIPRLEVRGTILTPTATNLWSSRVTPRRR
jgi:hypothetical protein